MSKCICKKCSMPVDCGEQLCPRCEIEIEDRLCFIEQPEQLEMRLG